MKKLVLIAALVLIASPVFGQAWHTANQASLAWDAVTTNTAGDVLTGDITYSVYLVNATTDPNKANPALVAEGIVATGLTVTLGTEGRFLAGVRAVRSIDGEVVAESEMSWSDDPLVVLDGKTFGLRYFLPPGQAKKLRIE